ncbi:hypothetical protein R3I93_003151 [Phoxinus phoxinus]|uniref:Uncharacterized protein n=1 Tax=Phoxinus phoxinus TaxID=58324 RepID=A0AAN9DMA9_9TELE
MKTDHHISFVNCPHLFVILQHTDRLHPWLPSDVIKLPCGCHTSWVDCGELWHPFPVCAHSPTSSSAK